MWHTGSCHVVVVKIISCTISQNAFGAFAQFSYVGSISLKWKTMIHNFKQTTTIEDAKKDYVDRISLCYIASMGKSYHGTLRSWYWLSLLVEKSTLHCFISIVLLILKILQKYHLTCSIFRFHSLWILEISLQNKQMKLTQMKGSEIKDVIVQNYKNQLNQRRAHQSAHPFHITYFYYPTNISTKLIQSNSLC